jgi:hypothetical protein
LDRAYQKPQVDTVISQPKVTEQSALQRRSLSRKAGTLAPFPVDYIYIYIYMYVSFPTSNMKLYLQNFFASVEDEKPAMRWN